MLDCIFFYIEIILCSFDFSMMNADAREKLSNFPDYRVTVVFSEPQSKYKEQKC